MKTTTPDGRLAWADFARGASILAVVYFHATLFLGAVGIDDTLGRAKAVFELFPLPTFFLIAGLFGARSLRTDTFADLARKRLLPLAYMYVLWSLLRFALFAAFPAIPARDTDVGAADPMSLLLLPVLPASLYWFLYALILFTIVGWFVRRLPRGVVIFAAAVLSTLFTSGAVETGSIAWNRIGALLVFFLLGTFFSAEIRGAVERLTPRHIAGLVVAWVVVVGLLAVFRSLAAIPTVVLIGQLVSVAVVIAVSRSLARISALAFVSASGKASLPIYLVHLFVIAPSAFALSLLTPDWPAAVNIAVTLSVTALAVLAGFGLLLVARRAPWLIAPAWPDGWRPRRRERAAHSAHS